MFKKIIEIFTFKKDPIPETIPIGSWLQIKPDLFYDPMAPGNAYLWRSRNHFVKVLGHYKFNKKYSDVHVQAVNVRNGKLLYYNCDNMSPLQLGVSYTLITNQKTIDKLQCIIDKAEQEERDRAKKRLKDAQSQIDKALKFPCAGRSKGGL